ncbi:MAG: hypothetical protein AVDCRST_MAG79-2538 [uncultured Thermoleophilia bacterium]|uniref:O-antigen ligase-related domain-containing protein n=1 Tax=uncultured Thermoleophilia bacterium TaxID=1497501 RepID=A0A6J4UHH5_9ACTN|nr:MAG: hypothetical protein AVDCRST_MAG79-2538 [uncultured Thermoleophilia bacterium]
MRPHGLDAVLLLVLVVCTWQKLSWDVLGRLAVTDVLETAFVLGFVGSRVLRGDRRVAATAAVVSAFGLAFLAVSLGSLGNVETDVGVDQWTKALTKWVIHFSFLTCAVAHLVRRGPALHRTALVAFVLGLAVNAAYAVAQLGSQAVLGVNLDRTLLAPIFTGAATSGANVYGRVSGLTVEGAPTLTTVYRGTGLVDDPNHLGVMLCVPICLLLAAALGLGGDGAPRVRWALTGLAGALTLVLLLTQSRSGLLGLAAGLATLAVPFRRELVSRATLVPAAVLLLLVAAFVAQRQAYVTQVLESRLQTGARGTNTHFFVYSLIPDVLDRFPLLGLGLNNFSILYEFETGRAGFGPHSYPVQVLTETGLLGALVTSLFLAWVISRALAVLRTGRPGDPEGRETRALGWGLLAAVVATLAGNLFYLTMTFPYWYAVVLLVVTALAVLLPRTARASAARTAKPVAAD